MSELTAFVSSMAERVKMVKARGEDVFMMVFLGRKNLAEQMEITAIAVSGDKSVTREGVKQIAKQLNASMMVMVSDAYVAGEGIGSPVDKEKLEELDKGPGLKDLPGRKEAIISVGTTRAGEEYQEIWVYEIVDGKYEFKKWEWPSPQVGMSVNRWFDGVWTV